MIPTTCPHGKDPCVCAYCDKKDTCDCRCDKNTDVIWGEITGELKDQTDLQAALDKHTADILTADTLAHSNEQRLDTVEGTANEANQRSKDNLTRLDSVEGTANATKALADVHTTRLNNVEGVANGANIRSQDNMKRLDRVEGVANGAQALANNHTELLNKANTAIADLIEQDKSHSESIEELTGTCETLQDDIDRVDGKVNATQATVNTKAAINHTHSSISLGSASVECVNDTSEDGTSAGKVKLLAPSVEARDNEDNPIFSTGRYTKNGSTTNEKQTIIFVGNKQYQAGDGTSADIVLNGDMELYATLQSLQRVKRNRFEMPMAIEQILSKGKLLNEKVCEYLYNAIMQYYGNYDYENDGNSEALRMLSGENIYPVILSKYYHVGEKTAHAQHFKPWRVEFYDEIQSYDNPEGVVSIPVIRIHIGGDFAEWLVHTGYKGLSEKVSYMEHRIGIGDMSKMPFSLYNASGTKLQEFTLI